jgi:hypothetical protein
MQQKGFASELRKRLKSGEIKLGRIKGTTRLLIIDILNEEWAEIDFSSIVEITDVRKELRGMSKVEYDEF